MRLASTEDQEIAAFEAEMNRENKQRTIKVMSMLTILILCVIGGIFGLAITMNTIASIFGA